MAAFVEDARAYMRGQLAGGPVREDVLWDRWAPPEVGGGGGAGWSRGWELAGKGGRPGHRDRKHLKLSVSPGWREQAG